MVLLTLFAAMQLPLVVSPSGPYRTVAAAIAAAPSGGTVVVKAGRYREPMIIVDRPLTLTGEPGAILDGEKTHALLVVRADNVTVQGLQFTATGGSFREDRAAVRVEDAQ